MTEEQAVLVLDKLDVIIQSNADMITQQQVVSGALFVLIGVIIACTVALIVTEVFRGI
jgi:uncharacterized membrane protein YccC